MASRDFLLQMQGCGLTTANIFYHLPDHPRTIQSYVWQDYDLHPDFLNSKNSSISGRGASSTESFAFTDRG